ncbi:MAG: hypothetical protein AB7I33_02955 [Gemmatimonadales bacterium]
MFLRIIHHYSMVVKEQNDSTFAFPVTSGMLIGSEHVGAAAGRTDSVTDINIDPAPRRLVTAPPMSPEETKPRI